MIKEETTVRKQKHSPKTILPSRKPLFLLYTGPQICETFWRIITGWSNTSIISDPFSQRQAKGGQGNLDDR